MSTQLTNYATAEQVDARLQALTTPPGSVLAWVKSIGGAMPSTLPAGWFECNGQAVTSTYLTATPNLNGTTESNRRFLRGSRTSGNTGGSLTHSHNLSGGYGWANAEVFSHVLAPTGGGGPSGAIFSDNAQGALSITLDGATQPADVLPPHYDVVYIIKGEA